MTHRTNTTPLSGCRSGVFQATAGILLLAFCVDSSAIAGTGIRLSTTDGSVIHARTFDYASPLNSTVIVVPHDQGFVGTTPGDRPGMEWQSNFAFVGVSFLDMPHVLDGVNEQGLAVGMFLFPGYADYVHKRPKDTSNALASWEVSNWLLSNFSTVGEVRRAVSEVIVLPVPLEAFGGIPPFHYIVHDAEGGCIVLEAQDGRLHVFDNPLGVIANAPDFHWQITNLLTYRNQSPLDVPHIDLKDFRIAPTAENSLPPRLPGDDTSPSRFVRAVWASQNAMPAVTGEEGVFAAFHVLNGFDIPRPLATDQYGDPVIKDYTVWTSAIDLKNARFYFHTYDNRRVRMVDLMSEDLDSQEIQKVSMSGGEDVERLNQGGQQQPAIPIPGGLGSGSMSIPGPVDIGDAVEDTVAKQLREAAEKEADPELRKKLWEEYEGYVKQSQ